MRGRAPVRARIAGVTQTLSEKVWDRHVVRRVDGEPDLLYIDLHLVHEVTSPQAFDSLRMHGRTLRRPDLTVSTIDHNNPTTGPGGPPPDEISAKQMEVLARNCEEFGVRLFGMGDPNRGIVHVIGPEQGLSLPGMTIVCGDSHTSTHGAFGALAFGIGTSEVEHVLATQTLPQAKPGTMSITVEGELPAGVTAKDIVLSIIARIGTGGGIGSIIEYRGSAIRALSMEGRMTVCNMSIEAGARAGHGGARRHHLRLPRGSPVRPERARPGSRRSTTGVRLPTDPDAGLRPRGRDRRRDAPAVGELGDQPRPDGVDRRRRALTRLVPRPEPARVGDARAALHGPEGGHADPRHRRRHGLHRLVHERPARGPAVPRPTSCAGRRVRDGMRALVVPGSMRVKAAAEDEGLDGSSPAPGSSGARRAARCASR